MIITGFVVDLEAVVDVAGSDVEDEALLRVPVRVVRSQAEHGRECGRVLRHVRVVHGLRGQRHVVVHVPHCYVHLDRVTQSTPSTLALHCARPRLT